MCALDIASPQPTLPTSERLPNTAMGIMTQLAHCMSMAGEHHSTSPGVSPVLSKDFGSKLAYRYYKGEAFYQAIARHEHYLSAQMALKPGMRVLDVGCGVGGPAREIARFSGAHVTGVNNNQYQVNKATKYTAQAGLSGQVDFVKGDFMGLSELFGEGTFDAVYAIEATVHAPNFEGIYGEIRKVLKPGGIVSLLAVSIDSAKPARSLASTSGA